MMFAKTTAGMQVIYHPQNEPTGGWIDDQIAHQAGVYLLRTRSEPGPTWPLADLFDAHALFMGRLRAIGGKVKRAHRLAHRLHGIEPRSSSRFRRSIRGATFADRSLESYNSW